MPARYAIYYAPRPGSALARFGDTWLGRSAATGADVAQPEVPCIAPERLRAATAEPRRYGFHGTLKPPFALVEGRTPDELRSAAVAFAAVRSPFVLPPLKLQRIGRFLALVPSAPCPELEDLAADAVRALDPFRAPPGEAELARRRRAPLTDRQERLLEAWGYPYVMEEFRFHLTLTGPLAADEQEMFADVLAPLTADLCRDPEPVDGVWLFRQDGPEAPFIVTAPLTFAANGP